MPAAVRGGSRARANPPIKSPPLKAPARRRPTQSRAATSDPVGLSPRLALAAAGAVLVVAVAVALATGHRGERLAASVATGVDSRFGQAGFRLRTVEVLGASPMATADIVKAARVYRNQPLLGLDLNSLRDRVKAVGWVREVKVQRLLPDTLVIAVVERRQLAVWQHDGRQSVIDEHGQPIPGADAARFPALPLVVGAGGAAHAPEILPVLVQRPRLMSRLDALIRVDDRRWDLRLKDGGIVQLPAVAEDNALMQLERMDQHSRILELGFERVDLRNPDVVAVRPRPAAAFSPQPATAGA